MLLSEFNFDVYRHRINIRLQKRFRILNSTYKISELKNPFHGAVKRQRFTNARRGLAFSAFQ